MRIMQWKLLLVTTLICSSSWAKLIDWTDNVPSSLSLFNNSAEELAGLTANRIVIFAHPVQQIHLPTMKTSTKTSARFYSGAVVIPTSSQNIAKLLSTYSGYAGLFPTVKSVRILEQKDSISQVRYSIHIPTPIPVLNFKENITMQHHLTVNSISSLVIDAPIPYGAGKLEWFDLGNNKTLVTITQWGDLTQPKGFIFSKILKALPEVRLGMPAGTDAFLLEALQRRYKPSSATPLKAGELPYPSLNSQQMQKIASLSQQSQEPVSFILPQNQVPYTHGMENMRFTTSYQYYAATPEALQPWLKPTAYKTLFPRQVKQIKTTAAGNNAEDAAFKISVGLGVISIPFDFQMRFQYPDATQNSFYANGGNLKFVRGAMRIIPQKNGTLLNVISAVKIDEKAPFLLRAMRSLPYHEMLPAVGGNTVFTLKIKQKLK